MNSQTHRLVFNPSRGCLMAVAETSRSCGKSGASGATNSTRTKRTRCRHRFGTSASNQHAALVFIAQTAIETVANFSSDEQQYQALMSAGITFAQAHQLRVGIALTAEQVAQLTSDMVWLVQREVTLADGSTQKVLVGTSDSGVKIEGYKEPRTTAYPVYQGAKS